MAIVKMKKLRVIAMAAHREELLRQLQRLGCVEIREPETAGEDWSGLLERESSRLAEAKGALAEVNTALAAMRRYGQVKDGLFVKRRLVTEKEFLGGGLEAQAKTVTRDVGERLRTLSGIQAEMSRLQARRAGLLPWQDLDLPLEAEGTEHVLFRLGTCPAGTDVGALRMELEVLPAELLEISADKQQRYLLLLCHRAEEEQAMEVLRAHGFSAAVFPGVTGTAAADLKRTDRQLEELQRRREEAEAAIAESARERDTLRTYADRLTAETARESAAERLLTDGTIVFFEGWAPAERMADVSALLERLGRQVVTLKKSVPGFLVNRFAQALFRESLDLLEKDVATPADIDRAVKYAVGMRYASIGLLEYFDAVGFELERAIAENVYPTLCNTDKIQKIVSDGIRDGRTGQKAGEGLYRWDEDSLADFRVRLQEPFLKSVENWTARK